MYTLYLLVMTYPALKYILDNEKILTQLLLFQKKINRVIELTPDDFIYKADLVQLSNFINEQNYMWYSEHAILILLLFIIFSIYDPIPIFSEIALNYPPDDWQIILLFAYWMFIGAYSDKSLGFLTIFIKVYNGSSPFDLQLLEDLMFYLDILEEGLLNDTLTLEETKYIYTEIIAMLKYLRDLLYIRSIS